jgi:hypothetical protein
VCVCGGGVPLLFTIALTCARHGQGEGGFCVGTLLGLSDWLADVTMDELSGPVPPSLAAGALLGPRTLRWRRTPTVVARVRRGGQVRQEPRPCCQCCRAHEAAEREGAKPRLAASARTEACVPTRCAACMRACDACESVTRGAEAKR